MREISGLLSGLKYELQSGDAQGEISQLVYDSRKIVPGCMFVAIKGEFFNGHDFVKDAISQGAKAVVVCEDVEVDAGDCCIIKVDDTRLALALISENYFDHPSGKVKVIGVTGTKGKTTSTYIIKTILDAAGHATGLIGTIETIIGDEHIVSSNTTPESYVISEYLSRMADKGIEYCVMEASSQGFLLHRTAGIDFEIGVFTNLSPDHIGPNEHKDFDDYLRCKRMLFTQCKEGIFNVDDEHFKEMSEGASCKIHTFGIEKEADTKGSDIHLFRDGDMLGTRFKASGYDSLLSVPLPGYFSVYNSLSAISTCKVLGISEEVIVTALKGVKVRGRIEPVSMKREYSFFIDYSHNAIALENILKTLRVYDPKRLIAIFGCGGNRDKNRRYEMGETSGKFADFTVITSDNPRYEEPADIMKDIETGINKTDGKYVMIEDRKEAIRYAIKHAKDGDIIVLAGKGHEDYQEIKGKKYHMDERELVEAVLSEEGLT